MTFKKEKSENKSNKRKSWMSSNSIHFKNFQENINLVFQYYRKLWIDCMPAFFMWLWDNYFHAQLDLCGGHIFTSIKYYLTHAHYAHTVHSTCAWIIIPLVRTEPDDNSTWCKVRVAADRVLPTFKQGVKLQFKKTRDGVHVRKYARYG